MRNCIWGLLCLLALSLGGVFADPLTLNLISVDPATLQASPNGSTWSDTGGKTTPRQCLSSAFEMPGQSWSQNVSAGGITELNVGSSIDPRSRGQALAPWLHLGTPGEVWVLVVDHFLPVQIQLKEGGASKPKIYSLSHGNLVIDHLRAVLVGAGFVAQPGNKDYEYHNQRGGSRVHLLTVEVGGLATSEVVKDIQRALHSGEVLNSSSVVINMSLALIPCEIQKNYDDIKVIFSKYHRLYRFNDYLHDLYLVNPQHPPVTETQFITSILNPPTVSASEPLHQFVNTLHGTYPKAVVVASSGNYGLPISTFPAAWPGVVGVGASNAQGGPAVIDGQTWPDPGDVTEVGQWFHLQTEDIQVGCFKTSQVNCVLTSAPGNSGPIGAIQNTSTLSYRGTSFSAPTVTAYIAMAMLSPTPTCVPPYHPLPANQFLPAATKLSNLFLQRLLSKYHCP